MALFVQQQQVPTPQSRPPKDYCSKPRSQQCQFQHNQALACIYCDYLGPNLLLGAEFHLMFCLSQGWFEESTNCFDVVSKEKLDFRPTEECAGVAPAGKECECACLQSLIQLEQKE
jgi:hypothetical protein